MQNQDELNVNNMMNDIVTEGLVQHVDLSKFIPRQQKVYLPFNQLLQICVVMLMVISGYSFYGNWQKTVIKKHIISLQAESNRLVEQMSSGRLKKLQELSGGDVIYTALKAEHDKNGQAFSNYLSAISKACPSGVWFTSIEIKKRINSTVLSGKAYRANNIMQLVDNLNRDALFSSEPFFLAKIEKIKEQTTKANEKTPLAQSATAAVIYNFTVRTEAQAVMEPKT